VTYADGSTESLAPDEDGVISAALHDPRTLRFTTDTGDHEVNIRPIVEKSISVDCSEGRVVPVDSPKQIGRACK
jgi:hypothetical protein